MRGGARKKQNTYVVRASIAMSFLPCYKNLREIAVKGFAELFNHITYSYLSAPYCGAFWFHYWTIYDICPLAA